MPPSALGVQEARNIAKGARVFTGIKPVRPLLRALPVQKYKSKFTEDEAWARQLINIEQVQSALSEIDKDVAGRSTASRERQVQRHMKRQIYNP